MTRVALIVGGGVGGEIAPPVVEILEAAGAAIEWQRVDVEPVAEHDIEDLLQPAVEAVKACGVGLKTRLLNAPTGTGGTPGIEPASGSRNPNVALRHRLDLFAGVRPIRPLPGIHTRYPDLDLLLVRENTEDIYKGIEHEIVPGVVQSLKVVTRQACERIARFAFEVAKKHGRRHLTFVHKGNIMKRSDGLFLDTVREVANHHPEIGYRERIADAACMHLVLDPYQFDTLLMGNLYGDILSNLCSGLAGGISGAHSINIGEEWRVYEAIHGDAPELVGKGRANPLPLLSPALALLRHIGEEEAARRIEGALSRTLIRGEVRTPDLGGNASTREMTDAILHNLTGP